MDRVKRALVPAAAILALLLAACGSGDDETTSPTAEPDPTTTTAQPSAPATTQAGRPSVVATIARDLEVPWGIAFLPDGSALVTERDSGRVLRVGAGSVTEVGHVAQARSRGEAGLLGIAVSPSYATDRQVFLYATTEDDNRVLRATYDGQRLGEQRVILDGIPHASIHDGGRLAFGPDGYLYVSTGDANERDDAQNERSLAGKILRITADGEPAPGNPDPGSRVWSMGHRNVQGLAFDADDRLWASEFGQDTWDELNLIRPGDNYGWPLIEGKGSEDGSLPEYRDPQIVWSTSDASPSGLAYADGRLWMASLRGERLWRIDVAGGRASKPKDFFVGKYGRMRTVVAAPDGTLWVTTSNRDGRGDPASSDDRILQIQP